ncbi:MAG: hypothetical protein R6T91_01630 [Bacteroidales bacterium]
MIRKKPLFVAMIALLLLLGSESLKAQTRIASPYSRYGIGNLSQTTNARTLGMGGVNQALSSRLYINYDNPATYSKFSQQSFVFNGGLRSQQTKLSTSDQNEQFNYTSLGYLQFGMPVTKWMGLSFGLMPYSNVGYNINDEYTYTDIGRVVYNYEGTGGINQFYLGSGFSITDKLSVGFNAVYYFGSMDFMRSSMFPDSVNILDTRITESQRPSDVAFNFGVHYETKIKEDYHLAFGATFSSRSAVGGRRDYLVESMKTTSQGLFAIYDTIAMDFGQQGDIVMPARLGGGVMFTKDGSWTLATDFTYENWENYESFGVKDSLQNSFSAAVGFEISPKSTSVSPYWKKVQYRLGSSYRQSYLQLRETQLNQFGISFGFGFPVPGSSSTIDLGVEVGQLGTTDHDLIEEKYVKVSLGLSIFERWFIQRKYD